jgi:hypothetical protein
VPSKPRNDETEKRLSTMLRGAFAGPPTPLKAIPKKRAESRGNASPKPGKQAKPSKIRAPKLNKGR